MTTPKIKDNKGALNNPQAKRDLQDYRKGISKLSQEQLAKKYNVTQGAISSALNRLHNQLQPDTNIDLYTLLQAYDGLDLLDQSRFRHYVGYGYTEEKFKEFMKEKARLQDEEWDNL